MKTKINGVWAIDDALTVAAPSLATIAEMLRTSAYRGDAIELQKAALKAADMLAPASTILHAAPQFRDEIGC